MDRRVLELYELELSHLRSQVKEYVEAFPKTARHLLLDSVPCPDPHVERLLEGFAYLAARVQRKIEAGYPRFTQSLLETVFPHYLAPTPSVAMLAFKPDLTDETIRRGYIVPRGYHLQSQPVPPDRARCTYQTAYETVLWPFTVTRASYHTRDTDALDVRSPAAAGARSALVLRLSTGSRQSFAERLAADSRTSHGPPTPRPDRLVFYLGGADERAMRLYEMLLARATRVVVRPARNGAVPLADLPADSCIGRVGFASDEAIFPYDGRSFSGYRLLHEYFACPERFMFVSLNGLGESIASCTEPDLQIIVLFDEQDLALERLGITGDSMRLYCTPAVNLFERDADHIFVSDAEHEHHLIVDRTAAFDYEVHAVLRVIGYESRSGAQREFAPFYLAKDADVESEQAGCYYSLHRRARSESFDLDLSGTRSDYPGTEVFLTLVDAANAPYSERLDRLAVRVRCTNRDLPLHMWAGFGRSAFDGSAVGPVSRVECLGRPSRPYCSSAEGEVGWRLVNHLSLNYSSLQGQRPEDSAASLRETLRLYGDWPEVTLRPDGPSRERNRRIIEAIQSVDCRPITGVLPDDGPLSLCRGIEATVTLDESRIEGSGAFLLGAVLEEYFARYVSLNSFSQTVIRTSERGEIKRWPARIGRRPTH